MSSGASPGFDSHAHLHFSHFDDDLQEVLMRAERAGITNVMIPSVDLVSARRASSIAISSGRRCFSAAAFHPEHLPGDDSEEAWRGIRRVLLDPRTVAVGETGLDNHHGTFSVDDQLRWFGRHIDLASALGYPIIIHSRKAEGEVLDALPRSLDVPVILHCWGGDADATARAVERGFYIGAGGPLTYPKNGRYRRVIQGVPGELLLCETDSPFLPPEPCRGRRNEPAHAIRVVQTIRELRGGTESIEGISFMLWENAMRAFLLHPEDRRAEIVYTYGDSAYVNLTSRCGNDCRFCIRRFADGVGGSYLRHREDPPAEKVISAIDALPLEDFPEVVFCGFGEPTLRSDLLLDCAGRLSRRGIRTRLNTNGLCTSFLSREKAAELVRSFDSINVSLNASGASEYNRICRPSTENAWDHLMKFISLVKDSGVAATVSAVEGSGADPGKVEALSGRLGLPLRMRGTS